MPRCEILNNCYGTTRGGEQLESMMKVDDTKGENPPHTVVPFGGRAGMCSFEDEVHDRSRT